MSNQRYIAPHLRNKTVQTSVQKTVASGPPKNAKARPGEVKDVIAVVPEKKIVARVLTSDNKAEIQFRHTARILTNYQQKLRDKKFELWCSQYEDHLDRMYELFGEHLGDILNVDAFKRYCYQNSTEIFFPSVNPSPTVEQETPAGPATLPTKKGKIVPVEEEDTDIDLPKMSEIPIEDRKVYADLIEDFFLSLPVAPCFGNNNRETWIERVCATYSALKHYVTTEYLLMLNHPDASRNFNALVGV